MADERTPIALDTKALEALTQDSSKLAQAANYAVGLEAGTKDPAADWRERLPEEIAGGASIVLRCDD
jgi:hypothetical protein